VRDTPPRGPGRRHPHPAAGPGHGQRRGGLRPAQPRLRRPRRPPRPSRPPRRPTVPGRPGVRPPRRRRTNAGTPVANLRVAVTQRIQEKDGTWRDGETSFHKVNVWRNQAVDLTGSLSKGDRGDGPGRLRQRSWEPPRASATVTDGASLRFHTAKLERASHRGTSERAAGREAERGQFNDEPPSCGQRGGAPGHGGGRCPRGREPPWASHCVSSRSARVPTLPKTSQASPRRHRSLHQEGGLSEQPVRLGTPRARRARTAAPCQPARRRAQAAANNPESGCYPLAYWA
jgi:single-strand DNA-binding protein